MAPFGAKYFLLPQPERIIQECRWLLCTLSDNFAANFFPDAAISQLILGHFGRLLWIGPFSCAGPLQLREWVMSDAPGSFRFSVYLLSSQQDFG